MFVLEESYSCSVCKFKFSWKQVFWIKVTPCSARSICYYTFTTGTDNCSLHGSQPARNCRSFSGKTKVGLAWQPVSRIWRKLKTKDMLQVVRSVILSKMSSMISLWRHSQAATASKYSSLPEGLWGCSRAVWGCGYRKCGFVKESDLYRTQQWCAGISPCEELSMWLNSAALEGGICQIQEICC